VCVEEKGEKKEKRCVKMFPYSEKDSIELKIIFTLW